ncbi:MAG: hypothetical protein ACE5LH_00650 [Fidelibacterota bacterium]
MAMNLDREEGEFRGSPTLAKSVVVARVVLTVSASDMETIEKDLALSSDRKTASGSVEVPRGKARKFTVEAIDANGVTQYSGSTTHDIEDDVETVSITTEGHYPTPVSLSVTGVGLNSVELEWTRNSDVDFEEYELYRSTSSTVDLTSTRVTVISQQATTSYVDGTVDLNTSYSYRMIVWDTEGLGFWSSVVTAPAEWGYDDNSFENGLIGSEQNEGLLVWFSLDAYPARLVGIEMVLWGTESFTIGIWDWETGTVLAGEAASGTNASAYEWVLYDMSGLDLTLEGDFFVGLNYTGSSIYNSQLGRYEWWPAIGLDQTSSARRSYDLTSTSFDLLDDLGMAGNLGIRVIVEQEGGSVMRVEPAGPAVRALPDREPVATGRETMRQAQGRRPLEAVSRPAR